MKYALDNNKECQIVDAANLINQMLKVKFQFSLGYEKVNSNTGKLEKIKTNTEI